MMLFDTMIHIRSHTKKDRHTKDTEESITIGQRAFYPAMLLSATSISTGLSLIHIKLGKEGRRDTIRRRNVCLFG